MNSAGVREAVLRCMHEAALHGLRARSIRMSVRTWDALVDDPDIRRGPLTPVECTLYGLPVFLDDEIPDGFVDVRTRYPAARSA
jgi:hypothetical protein